MAFPCMIAVFLCVPFVVANGCLVLAPNRVRVSSNETLVVFGEGASQRVVVTMKDLPLRRKAIFSWIGDVNSGQPKVIDFLVKEEDVLDSPEILVEATCGAMQAVRTQLDVIESGNIILIQTDKPVYSPGQPVHVSIISLDGTLRPLDKPFLLEVWNPLGHSVKEQDVSAADFDDDYRVYLPEPVMLGTWSIVVRNRRGGHVLATKSFKVSKYKLPLFTTKIEGNCSFILDNGEAIAFRVTARFPDMRDVHGNVRFRLGTRGYGEQTTWHALSTAAEDLDSGKSTITITRDLLKNEMTDEEWQQLFRNGRRLVFEATVTEGATGVKQTATHDACLFASSPFIISFENNKRSYKPGINTKIMVDVSYLDGKRAGDIRLRATAQGAVIDGANTVDTDGAGQAIFNLRSNSSSIITFTVKTQAAGLSNDQQAQHRFEIKPYTTTSNELFAIVGKDTRNLKVGNTFKVQLFLEPQQWERPVYYLVTSKGRIVLAGMVTATATRIERDISFTVKKEMAPSFRLIAFSRLQDGTLATDSIHVKAESDCDSENWFQSNNPTSSNTLEVTVKGSDGAVVTLAGIDSMLPLHDAHVVTKDKVNAALDSKDLGCGVGGGTDAYEEFINSGLVLLSKHSETRKVVTCDQKHRKKRQAPGQDAQDMDIIDITVRNDIRDVWFFTTVKIEGGIFTHIASLPGSITTWTLSAVRVSPEGGVCVAGPVPIIVPRSNIQLDVHAPYSVRKNEHIQLPVTVYNRGQESATVSLFLHKTDGMCTRVSSDGYSDKMKLIVPAHKGVTTLFPMAAIEAPQTTVNVIASSERSGDSVTVPIRVEEPWVPHTETVTILLDPANVGRREQMVISTDFFTDTLYSNGTERIVLTAPHSQQDIPGSEIYSYDISIIGIKPKKLVDATVAFPVSMLPEPWGCRRKISTRLATNVYAYGYNDALGTLTRAFENKAKQYITKGVSLVEGFRRNDGSYDFNWSGSSSVWATSFIVRSLCEAKRRMINVGNDILSKGLSFLIRNQGRDGSFKDETGINKRGDVAGGATGTVEVTAYAVLTVAECRKAGVQMSLPGTLLPRAHAYLDRYLPQSSDFGLAIGAYALSVSNSSLKATHLRRLKDVVIHIAAEDERYVRADTKMLTNEATAYAMLAFINEGEGPGYVSTFTKRLNKHFQPEVSFGTTQETVVGLLALGRYTTYTERNKASLDMTVEIISSDRPGSERIAVREGTARILKNFQIKEPASVVQLLVRGVGTAQANITHSVKKKECQVNIAANVRTGNELRRRAGARTGNRNRTPAKPYMTEVCLRALGSEGIEQAVVDVGLFTGFEPDLDFLEQATVNGTIESFERTPRSVRVIVPFIPHNESHCVNIGARDFMRAGNMQASYIHVYSRTNSDIYCTKFYSLEGRSPLVKMHCDEDNKCKCVEGGCPAKNRLQEITKKKNKGQSLTETFQEFVCEQVDFVWKGKIQSRRNGSEYLHAGFYVTQVIKKGSQDVEGRVPRIRMQAECTDIDFSEDGKYIFMGKDSDFKDSEGDIYLVDGRSVWISLKQPPRSYFENLLINWLNSTFPGMKNQCPS